MAEQSNAGEQRLEEIVAYLDGELSAEESARVERRLASDESYRQQLQGVERAWKALDELPMLAADDKFSRTTMELAVDAARAEVQEKTIALPLQRRRGRLATWFVAAAAAALAFMVVQLAWQNPERMLLADLPVIDNVDVYSQIDDPDYLRLLRTEFGPELDELGGEPDKAPDGADRMQVVMQAGLRDSWLRELAPAERTNLQAKFNRFRELPPQEQHRLRQLHQQIASAPDSSELQRALFVYHEWLHGLPPARQFELRSMPAAERVRTVRQWASEMRDDALFALSEEELRRFVRKMREPLNELLRSTAKDMLRAPQVRRPNRMAEPMGPNLPRELAMQFASEVARPGKFQSAVVEALPERTRAPFEQLPPREKVERVMAWKRQAEALQGEVSEQELERFFAEELDAETRAELLSLPPGEMQQALRRLYRRQPGRGFAGAGAWGQGRGRDGRGGPDGRRPDGRGPDGRGGPEGRGPREQDGRPPWWGDGPRGDGPRGEGPPPRPFGPRGERGDRPPEGPPGAGPRARPPRDGASWRRDDDPPPPRRDGDGPTGDRPRGNGPQGDGPQQRPGEGPSPRAGDDDGPPLRGGEERPPGGEGATTRQRDDPAAAE
jgi:hypothetical protein